MRSSSSTTLRAQEREFRIHFRTFGQDSELIWKAFNAWCDGNNAALPLGEMKSSPSQRAALKLDKDSQRAVFYRSASGVHMSVVGNARKCLSVSASLTGCQGTHDTLHSVADGMEQAYVDRGLPLISGIESVQKELDALSRAHRTLCVRDHFHWCVRESVAVL
jgi:hypothetical protein